MLQGREDELQRESKPQMGLLGDGEKAEVWGGMGPPPLPAQSATESIMCFTVSRVVMKKGCWAPLNLGVYLSGLSEGPERHQ